MADDPADDPADELPDAAWSVMKSDDVPSVACFAQRVCAT
jgi:hypothetical protein